MNRGIMKLSLLLGLLCVGGWTECDAALVDYYGTVAVAGKGIPDVPVTDGKQIVLTDKKGNYVIHSDEDANFVYLTLPDGYKVPMSDDRTPAFYKRVPVQKKNRNRLDFQLERSEQSDENHVLVVWADPQVYFDEEMDEVEKASTDVKELLKKHYNQLPAYGIVCGDIIGDIKRKPDFFAPMIEAVSHTEIPFFYAIGNHDMDLGGRTNESARTTYQSHFGPTYYSFNRGKVHYVVLDDIFFIGKSYLYVGYLTEKQFRWLEQDLKQVQPGSTVVVATHIPTFSREARRKEWGKESTMKVMNNRAALYELLKPYNVHIMSGHEHYNENYVLADNLYEHVHAPLSTLFWQAPWACDGTPGGYAVYEFKGSDVSWYYKCVGRERDYQFQLYPVGAFRKKPDAILANIWNYDSTWNVKWFENGIERGDMKQISGYDPSIANYCERFNATFKHKYIGADVTEHLFYAVPQLENSKFRVEVTDHCGRKYVQELENKKK